MRRRKFLTGLSGAIAAWPLAVGAQPGKVRTILWVSTEAQPDPFIDGFRDGMRERGYSEGQNLAFKLRYAPGDPGALRAMLPEILALPADLIVSSGPAIIATSAVKAKPVLFAISSDPVTLGIAESLARPGRNFTGITFMSLDVAQKRVEILKELMPHLRTLAVLSNTTHPGEQLEYDATKRSRGGSLLAPRSMRPSLRARISTLPWSTCGAPGRMRCSPSPAEPRGCTR